MYMRLLGIISPKIGIWAIKLNKGLYIYVVYPYGYTKNDSFKYISTTPIG
jgi:hypothetical protein